MRKNRHGRKNWWPVIYGMILTAYAVFTLLDAFVIPRDMVSMEEAADHLTVQFPTSGEAAPEESGGADAEKSVGMKPSEDEAGSTVADETDEMADKEPLVTRDSYISENISITITTLERYETQIYIADVILQDASCLKTGLAGDTFGRNISDTTSEIARSKGAILAVNGDYYGFRDRGFVMREGYLYRDTPQGGFGHEDLVVYEDGAMEIVKESESDASELAEAGAVQIFSFGPGLVQNGEISVDENSEVEQAMRSNPRTAIGEIGPLHYVFVVSDGRTEESAGLTLWELAGIMQELGCRTAYNLDGGGSSTMWFMGEVVNHPTSGWRIGERSVSDIVYIGE